MKAPKYFSQYCFNVLEIFCELIVDWPRFCLENGSALASILFYRQTKNKEQRLANASLCHLPKKISRGNYLLQKPRTVLRAMVLPSPTMISSISTAAIASAA